MPTPPLRLESSDCGWWGTSGKCCAVILKRSRGSSCDAAPIFDFHDIFSSESQRADGSVPLFYGITKSRLCGWVHYERGDWFEGHPNLDPEDTTATSLDGSPRVGTYMDPLCIPPAMPRPPRPPPEPPSPPSRSPSPVAAPPPRRPPYFPRSPPPQRGTSKPLDAVLPPSAPATDDDGAEVGGAVAAVVVILLLCVVASIAAIHWARSRRSCVQAHPEPPDYSATLGDVPPPHGSARPSEAVQARTQVRVERAARARAEARKQEAQSASRLGRLSRSLSRRLSGMPTTELGVLQDPTQMETLEDGPQASGSASSEQAWSLNEAACEAAACERAGRKASLILPPATPPLPGAGSSAMMHEARERVVARESRAAVAIQARARGHRTRAALGCERH